MSESIIRIAKYIGISVKRGDEYKNRYYEKPWKITTGVNSLDDLLGGGIYPYQTYEFFGAAGSGKTQLALQLAITSQFKSYEERECINKVIYIDTEKSFSTERLIKIASRFGCDSYRILRNIFYAYTFEPDKLLSLITHARKIITDVRLIIIDNIAIPLQNLPNRNPRTISRYIQKLMFEITKIMDKKDLSVVITNRIYAVTNNVIREVHQPYGGITLSSFMHKEIILMKLQELKYYSLFLKKCNLI